MYTNEGVSRWTDKIPETILYACDIQGECPDFENLRRRILVTSVVSKPPLLLQSRMTYGILDTWTKL